MLLPGIVGYSFGSFNSDLPTTRMQVTNVALTSNVATLGVQMVEGNIPAVGSLISVRGTQKAGGAFNVSNIALTGVSIVALTGIGTVTFALTHADVTSTPDAGAADVPVPEVAEAMANSTGLQLTMQSASGLPNNSRDVEWTILTPSAPASFSAALQVADTDAEADYSTIDTSTAVGSRQVAGVRANFIRIKLSSVVGGTLPTVIGKVLV